MLELFDEAPDDGANWGNVISTLEKVKDIESTDDESIPKCTVLDTDDKDFNDSKLIKTHKVHLGNINQPIIHNVKIANDSRSARAIRFKNQVSSLLILYKIVFGLLQGSNFVRNVRLKSLSF